MSRISEAVSECCDSLSFKTTAPCQEQSSAVKAQVDYVNHPKHYTGHKFEVIDIIEDFGLGFNLGNAVKYLLRCDKKWNKAEDLSKAVWYINREIESAKRNG